MKKPILRLLSPAKSLIIWTVSVLFVVMFVELASPLFSQVFIDSIITKKHPEWQTPMLIILGVIVIFSAINVMWSMYVRSLLIYKEIINLDSVFIWHVLRLPIKFFSHLSVSDLIIRRNSAAITFSRLVHRLLPSVVIIGQIALMICLMFLYSPLLSLISLISVILNVISMIVVFEKQKSISRLMNESEAAVQTLVSSGVSNIESVKTSGAEDAFFRRCMDAFSHYINQSAFVNYTLARLNFVPTFLQQLTTIISLCVGALLIMYGELTTGLLFAFQGFLTQFLTPISTLIRNNQLMMTASSAAERYHEIIDLPTDTAEQIELVPIEELDKLSGGIELRNVTFGYDSTKPALIENISLTIKPGQSIALVGSSGSGKSTIANLITGLHQPWSGEVLFDGKKKENINRYCFYNSVAVVNQDITLFDGSIAENIKMWDNVTEDFAMIYAAQTAQIHQDIAARPNGYEDLVMGGGNNFSGGQKQRIEIATAIAKEPVIMVMDEATSALDPATELKVMEGIKAQGITTIVVAHRLSTIRDCDEILVLDKGKIVDRGTHDELMQHPEGLYYKLMQMN